MTTNSPNTVDGEVQALIADCQTEIAELEKRLTTWGEAWNPYLQSKLKRQQIALASLKSEPVYQLIDDGKWYDAPKYLFDEASERGDECRIVYTTPPAQLLRPVELPGIADNDQENFFGCRYEFCAGWNHCLEEVKQALRQQGYEVKS